MFLNTFSHVGQEQRRAVVELDVEGLGELEKDKAVEVSRVPSRGNWPFPIGCKICSSSWPKAPSSGNRGGRSEKVGSEARSNAELMVSGVSAN